MTRALAKHLTHARLDLGISVALCGMLVFEISCARCGPTQPAELAPLPSIGVVVHATTAADAAQLAAMHVGAARVSYYGDSLELSDELDALRAAGIVPLVVAMQPPVADLAETWQIGNEPLNLLTAAAAFRRAHSAAGGLDLLPPGVAHGVNVDTLRAAIAAGLGDAGVLCLHAYGSPLKDAVRETIATARAAGWTGRIWLTEIGAQTGPDQTQQLKDAIAAARGIERVYVYALSSPDDSYTLTAESRAYLAQLLAGGAQ